MGEASRAPSSEGRWQQGAEVAALAAVGEHNFPFSHVFTRGSLAAALC